MQHWACWWKNNLLSIGLYGSIPAHTGKREEKRKTCLTQTNPRNQHPAHNRPQITPKKFFANCFDRSALQALFIAIVAPCYAPISGGFPCMYTPIYRGWQSDNFVIEKVWLKPLYIDLTYYKNRNCKARPLDQIARMVFCYLACLAIHLRGWKDKDK